MGGPNKLYGRYFVVVKASLESYQPFNAICIIVTILVFSGCYSVFTLCHTDEICQVPLGGTGV